jgi:uncharacterized protein YndB with AHSA1/START domain
MISPTSHNDTTLVLRRTFRASRKRVFQAWITPRALEQWLRPRGKSMTVRALDARTGGSFCFELEDGSSLIGTYLEFVPPEKLVYTWTGGAALSMNTIVTLDFIDHGPVTELVLTHEGLNTEAIRALVEGGWPGLLDALDRLLSSLLLDL